MAISTAVVGRKLQEARKKKNYTQAFVAEKIELSITQMSRIENGSRSITLEKLSILCDLLDVSIVEILAAAETTEHPAYGPQFVEIAEGCKPETVGCMLEACRIIARVEKQSCGE